MYCRKLEDEEMELYQRFVDKSVDGTPFHGLEWLEAVHSKLGKSYFVLACFSDEGSMMGVIPVSNCRDFGGAVLCSIAYRDQGGVLAENDESRRLLLGELIVIARKESVKKIHLHRDAYLNSVPDGMGFERRVRGVDCCLDLIEGEDDYWKRLAGTERWAVRKARKRGYRFAEKPEDFEEDFFKLFRATRMRLGAPEFPSAFIGRLLRSDQFRLTVILNDEDECCAGLLWAVKGSNGYSIYLGYERSAAQDRVVDLLYFETISQARLAQIEKFRFGCDSESQKSLIDYKRKWLAKPEKIDSWIWELHNKENKQQDIKNYSHVRSALQKMPRPIFSVVSRICLWFWY